MSRRSILSIMVVVACAATLIAVPARSGSAVDGWDFVYGSPGTADFSRYEVVKLDPAGGAFFVGYFSGNFEQLSSPTSYQWFIQHRAADGSVSWTRPIGEIGTALPDWTPSLAVDPNSVAYVSSCVSPESSSACTRRTFDRSGTQLGIMEDNSSPWPRSTLEEAVVASADGFIVLTTTWPLDTPGLTKFDSRLAEVWRSDLALLADSKRPRAMTSDGGGGVWIASDVPPPLPTQRPAIAFIRISADGVQIRSAKHFDLSLDGKPLRAANRDFFWLRTVEPLRPGDPSSTGRPRTLAFRTDDGSILGEVTCPDGPAKPDPSWPGCAIEFGPSGDTYPDLLNPALSTVVSGGRRAVAVFRPLPGPQWFPHHVDVLDLSGVTDLTVTPVQRIMLGSTSNVVIDADDVGNIVIAGSTSSDVVFVRGASQSAVGAAAIGTAAVQERAFVARNPGGRVGLKVTPFVPFEMQVTGVNGVPDTGVGAVSLNVTVTQPDGNGFITVYPCGERKVVSSLNYIAGQTVPNAVITPISPQGTVCFYAQRTAHLLADVNGWFTTGSGYTPLEPQRVFDTRPGEPALLNATRVKIDPNRPLEIPITGIAGVPAGATAVSLNVTVTEPNQPGFVTVYPCGTLPKTSSLNFTAGQTVPNAVIAPISPRGTICFASNTPTHLLADVNGWFTTGSGYTPLEPQRVFDTRPGEPAVLNVTRTKIGPGRIIQVDVRSLAAIPDNGVSAVSLNVTATQPDGNGFVTVYPCGTLREVSSLNFVTRQTTPNAVIAPLSPTGTICFYSNVTTHLLADLNGWFATGSGYTPLDPQRLFDTR